MPFRFATFAYAVASEPHQATIKAVLKDGDGNPMPNQTISFTLANSHPVYPASINPQTAVTDASGVARTTLTSSRKVGATATVTAHYGDKSAQTAAVTMRAAEGRRRYGILQFNRGYSTDNGWDFDGLLLFDGDEVSLSTYFLKFRKNESAPLDEKYFLMNGQPVASVDTDGDEWVSPEEAAVSEVRPTLDDNDNWLSVSGHRLEIRIMEIIDADGFSVTLPDPDYAYLCDAGGNRIDGNGYVTVTTDGSGRAHVYLRAGPLINQVSEIKLKAVDITQVPLDETP